MSETSTEQASQQNETPQGEPADLGDAGKRALDAERTRASRAEREAKALRTRIESLEADKLSDVERAQKVANEATAKLAEYELTNMRQRVALAKGLPADLVTRLRGETEDEIASDADTLLELVNARPSPKPDPSQGARGGDANASTGQLFASAVEGMFTT